MKSTGPLVLLAGSLFGLSCEQHPVDLSDNVPPAAIADLVAMWSVDTTVLLRWIAPGDDGSSGTAAAYEIRYSTEPLTDAASLQAAALVILAATHAAGSHDSVAVGGLVPGKIYCFRVRAADEAGNCGAWSNVASAPTSNHLPEPTFMAQPDSLAVGDTLTVDASASRDAESGTDIDLRWDWNGDGAWDTPWSRLPIARHSVGQPGRYAVRLQARDEAGGTAVVERPLVVSSFGCRAQKIDLYVQVSGSCCYRTANNVCRSCQVRHVAADSTRGNTAIERAIEYQFGAARARLGIQRSEAAVGLETDMTTLDAGAAAAAGAGSRFELELKGGLDYTVAVDVYRRSGTGSATWQYQLRGPDGGVLADLGGDCLTGSRTVTQSGRLGPGIFTLRSWVEAASTSDAGVTFGISFAAVPTTKEARP